MTAIRPATPADRAAILAIGRDSGLFAPDEMTFFANDFDSWGPQDPRVWLISVDKAVAAQVVPEPMSDNVWNVLFIATRPDARRRGQARRMLAAIADVVRDGGGRMVLIDTASPEDMAPARALYLSEGYAIVATIPDYYGDGVDRITFAGRV